MGQEGLQVAGERARQGLSTPLSVKQLKETVLTLVRPGFKLQRTEMMCLMLENCKPPEHKDEDCCIFLSL